MSAKFIAEEGQIKGLTLTLENVNVETGEPAEWIIGSDPDMCNLLIEEPSVAASHLICRNSAEGILIENLSEDSPIFVNNEEVEEPWLLKNGDNVKIGNNIFRYYVGDEAEQVNEENQEIEENQVNDMEPTENELDENLEEKMGEQADEYADEQPDEQNEEQTFIPTDEQNNNQIDEESSEHDTHDTIYGEETEEDKGILAEIDFDLKDTGRWLLKVIGGPNNGAEFSMKAGESYIIGTDPNRSDIVFHDTSVSREHAKITITDTDTMYIEDLRSRNGTLIDGEAIKERQVLDPNTLVTIGTTSFLVFDREGDMQTIISPLMPSIVRSLQKETSTAKEDSETGKHHEASSGTGSVAGSKSSASTAAGEAATLSSTTPTDSSTASTLSSNAPGTPSMSKEEKTQRAIGSFILIGIISGIFIVVGFGTIALFRSEKVEIAKKYDAEADLKLALSQFPEVTFNFNPNSGQLLLVGHVLTFTDKDQLKYNLQGMNFIKNIDSKGLIIDELVWRETNMILNRDPRWKGISVHSPKAGTFILSGYLKTRKEAEDLSDYVTANFPYLDLLDNKVIVDEDVINSVETNLENSGLKNVTAQMNNGELTLSGRLSGEQMVTFDRLKKEFADIPGIRKIKTFITETDTGTATVDLSNKYRVTGTIHQGGMSLSVVINGRILTKGDTIDGMVIKEIKPTVILLEKDGVTYQINFS